MPIREWVKKRTVIRDRRTTVLDSPHPPGLNAVKRSQTTAGDEFTHLLVVETLRPREGAHLLGRNPGEGSILLCPCRLHSYLFT